MVQINKREEIQLIIERYVRRKSLPELFMYDPLSPAVYMGQQEKQRTLIHCLKRAGMPPLADRRLLEIGCGSGSNLQIFLSLGFRPDHLVGNELLEDRLEIARKSLPSQVTLLPGDASELELPDMSFDIVVQSTVFTSILDLDFQQKLARRMWRLVNLGGGVLWYDFTFNNPRNPDVRGIPMTRIRELFPEGRITAWRLTLVPPLSRFVTKIHPICYTLFNMLPFLRTHVLCWIRKD
jgi:ubiquinone/menaquinone biosynthesis C-methylase UbiE